MKLRKLALALIAAAVMAFAAASQPSRQLGTIWS
jgi:hypothetical protein